MDIITDPKAPTKDPNINLDEYEEVPPISVKASEMLANTFVDLGRPDDPLSKAGGKMMDVVISVWEDLYPKDRDTWLAQRREYKEHEMGVREQVHKHTGRSLASYPYPVYQMMKKVFPTFDPTTRDNAKKMVKKWPIFQFANRL